VANADPNEARSDLAGGHRSQVRHETSRQPSRSTARRRRSMRRRTRAMRSRIARFSAGKSTLEPILT
jgi:hypothetical protein